MGDNVEEGIYPIAKALKVADELELDLIEIAPMAQPPVCRVMDYQKFLYQQRKRLKEQKAKSVKVVVKEIRFGPQTDEHDYNFKMKQLKSTPIKSLRLDFSVTNVFTLCSKKLQGQSPTQAGFASVNLSARPAYTLGLNISF